MAGVMIVKVADTIVSPLGTSTEENFRAVLNGRSALREYQWPTLPEPFVASLMNWENVPREEGLTRFESLVVQAVRNLIPQLDVSLSSPRVLFILSTTKGNVEQLEEGVDALLGETALKIAGYFGNTNVPLVVSNACISGLSAQIAAVRALESGCYDYAVVVGADVQSRFIISGFQSFKALSPEPCRPFDVDRQGLNLGEAAAAIVYQRVKEAREGQWMVVRGAVRNDANHISGPSRTGEGSYRALRSVLSDTDINDVAFVNVHGTSTLYNDEMESIALERAGLTNTPVNSLKGYYGHTMGAAGILEVILSMRAVEEHVILGTRGFEHIGVSRPVLLSRKHTTTDRHCFVKLLSGFGGCNAAMMFKQVGDSEIGRVPTTFPPSCQDVACSSRVQISPEEVILNGKRLPTKSTGSALLTELYREYIHDYPKFFKMDELSKLGFVAAELLLGDAENRDMESENRAVILFNRTSSLCNDKNYQSTISNLDNFFPSPSLFVYTLPNIVTGEIAIRNKYYGETSFYVLDQDRPDMIREMAKEVMREGTADSVICGWVDCEDKDHFLARVELVHKPSI